MEKRRYDIEVADVQLPIISDEREEFVRAVVKKIDEEIRDLTVRSKRCSKIDAAILCSIDYCSEKLKADKRIRNLEAQISLYDVNMRRMREEIERLSKKLGIDTPYFPMSVVKSTPEGTTAPADGKADIKQADKPDSTEPEQPADEKASVGEPVESAVTEGAGDGSIKADALAKDDASASGEGGEVSENSENSEGGEAEVKTDDTAGDAESAGEKLNQIEQLLMRRKAYEESAAEAPPDEGASATKSDKLSQIEALLHRND